MVKLLLKTPSSHEPADNLDAILKLGGDELVMAYGYVRYGKFNKGDFEKIFAWMTENDTRTLVLIFGVRGEFAPADPGQAHDFLVDGEPYCFACNAKELQDSKSALAYIFHPNFIPVRLYDRVTLIGAANFHAKFMYLSENHPLEGENNPPLALQIGSSNFTGQARKGLQIELDAYFVSDGSNLSDAAKKIRQAISAANRYRLPLATGEVESETLGPWREFPKEVQKYKDELREKKEEEQDALERASQAEIDALIASDLAQEIGAIRPEDYS